MILQCPVKVATRFSSAWHHALVDLVDFKRCISQYFGENQLPIYHDMGLLGHNGIDVSFETGDEVYASHDGIAEYTQDSARGLGITIKTSGFKTIYWHLLDAVKPLNSTWEVKKGELIGRGDNTGISTGSHLHYGLKLLDINGDVINRNNGYDGAVDPLPYIVWWGMTEKEVKQLQALEGYSDPAGVAYWTGKPLSEYLKARLPDKVKTINESL